LLWPRAVPNRFVLWGSLRRLVLIVINVVNVDILDINFDRNYLHRLVALNIGRPCSSCPSYLRLDLIWLILVSSTILSGTAKVVDVQVVDGLVIYEVLWLRVSIFLRVSLSSWWNFFLVLNWVRWHMAWVLIISVIV
jgi:hypothetical protein